MVRFVVGTAKDIPTSLYLSMGRFRYETFVEMLHWHLPDSDETTRLEFDCFDTQSAKYVIGINGEGVIIACARLLPTTRPYLLQCVFPSLVEKDTLPNSDDVWEISRLAVERSQTAIFQLSQQLFTATILTAAQSGAHSVIGVITVGMERFYRRIGFPLRRFGTVSCAQGEQITACTIDTSYISIESQGTLPISVEAMAIGSA
jgi:acyl homoserine lactone synthase